MRLTFCDMLLIVSLVALGGRHAYSPASPCVANASWVLFLPTAVLYVSASTMQQLNAVSPNCSAMAADIDGKRHKYLLAAEKLWVELDERMDENVRYALRSERWILDSRQTCQNDILFNIILTVPCWLLFFICLVLKPFTSPQAFVFLFYLVASSIFRLLTTRRSLSSLQQLKCKYKVSKIFLKTPSQMKSSSQIFKLFYKLPYKLLCCVVLHFSGMWTVL